MRFVFAIVAFVVAAVMIGAGIAQRTVFAPPEQISQQVALGEGTGYAVLDGDTLGAHPGRQTLTLTGGSKPFVAYGRTADVEAWVHGLRYDRIRSDAEGDALVRTLVKPGRGDTEGTGTPSSEPSPTEGKKDAPSDGGSASDSDEHPDPVGSDLWLQEYRGKDARTIHLNVPSGISLLISSEKGGSAPASVTVVWPYHGTRPWSGPLLVGGGIMFLLGLFLFVWGIRHLRRSRGPRRKGPKMPKPPKSRRYAPTGAIEPSSHGRRAVRRTLATTAVVVLGGLALSGCSADYWPSFGGSAEATSTPSPSRARSGDPQAAPPAVTPPQLRRIVDRITAVAKKADAKHDASLLSERFTGNALRQRKAYYTISKKVSDNKEQVAPIPEGTLSLELPEATDSWPQIVQAVLQPDDEKKSPTMLVLVQESPRENYRVHYAIQIQGSPVVPELAPSSVGAPVVPADSKLLILPPGKVGPAYAGILMKGKKADHYDDFDASSDSFRDQVGAEAKAKLKKKIESEQAAKLSFGDGPAEKHPIAMATNNSGAIVATSVTETTTAKPSRSDAEVYNTTLGKALSGVDSSSKGLTSTHAYELLFYVPPAGSQGKIRLLGYGAGLIDSTEVK